MKLKPDFSIAEAERVLKEVLSSNISVQIKTNIFNTNNIWININKDAFVGLKVTFFTDGLSIVTCVPNFFARMFFGGFIGGVFHHNARVKFKKQIEEYLIQEFYE